MAVLPNPPPARSTSSRRASSGVFLAPAQSLDKPKTGRVTKKRETKPMPIPKAPKDDSFVSGDMFNFVGKIFKFIITAKVILFLYFNDQGYVLAIINA